VGSNAMIRTLGFILIARSPPATGLLIFPLMGFPG
jgi:hypothetical protein